MSLRLWKRLPAVSVMAAIAITDGTLLVLVLEVLAESGC